MSEINDVQRDLSDQNCEHEWELYFEKLEYTCQVYNWRYNSSSFSTSLYKGEISLFSVSKIRGLWHNTDGKKSPINRLPPRGQKKDKKQAKIGESKEIVIKIKADYLVDYCCASHF